jgi:hypothetical protein
MDLHVRPRPNRQWRWMTKKGRKKTFQQVNNGNSWGRLISILTWTRTKSRRTNKHVYEHHE